MRYQIGNLNQLNPRDPKYMDIDPAMKGAEELGRKLNLINDYSCVGIWELGSYISLPELIYIYCDGKFFIPEGQL